MGRLMGPDIAEPAAKAAEERQEGGESGKNAATPPLTAADVVTAMTQVLAAQQPAKVEPPIEPAGWSPFAVAALRAVLTALLVGAITFFSVWSHTNDVKEIALAVGPAMLGVIAARFGLEGNYDAARWERTTALQARTRQ